MQPETQAKSVSTVASASACLCVPPEKFEEGGRGVRERRAASDGGPERAAVGEVADGDGRERAAFEFFGDAHARDEGDADLFLNEALDRLGGREFERNIKRGVVLDWK